MSGQDQPRQPSCKGAGNRRVLQETRTRAIGRGMSHETEGLWSRMPVHWLGVRIRCWDRQERGPEGQENKCKPQLLGVGS